MTTTPQPPIDEREAFEQRVLTRFMLASKNGDDSLRDFARISASEYEFAMRQQPTPDRGLPPDCHVGLGGQVVCSGKLEGIGPPLKYTDGSYSREYEEHPQASEIPSLNEKAMKHLIDDAHSEAVKETLSYEGIDGIYKAIRPYLRIGEPVSVEDDVEECRDCDSYATEIGEIVRVARENPSGLREFLQLNFPKEWGLTKEQHRAILGGVPNDQPDECTPFKSGDTHCGDCPCRYGKHIREPKLDNLNREDTIEDLFHAMRALFGNAYQPSRTQAETLLNTLLESLDLRSTKRESGWVRTSLNTAPDITMLLLYHEPTGVITVGSHPVGSDDWYDYDGSQIHEPTYWMQLPEIPRRGTDD